MYSPFVKVTVFFLLGYVAAVVAGPLAVSVWVVIAAGMGLIITLGLLPHQIEHTGCPSVLHDKRKRGQVYMPALLHKLNQSRPVVLLLVTVFSFCYYQWIDSRNQSEMIQLVSSKTGNGGVASPAGTLPPSIDAALTGILLTPPTVDGDKATFVLQASTIEINEEGSYTKEKLQISIRLLKETEQITAAALRRGDAVILHGKLLVPEPARNFGGFDYQAYLYRQHIHFTFNVKGMDNVKPKPPMHLILSIANLRGDSHHLFLLFMRQIDQIREHLEQAIEDAFPRQQSGYMKGLIIGSQNDIDIEQYREFSNLGLTHLLAISGLHVAVFTATLLWLFRRIRITRESAMLAVIITLPFYIILTGASPSIVRAGMMAMLALYAARKGKLKDGLHLVCATALVMLLWEPYYLLNVGFQLSFLVTAGLILGVPPVTRLLPVANRALNSTLAVTLVAQAVSFPLTIYYFNQFSLLSMVANLLLVPLVSFVVTPVGTLSMLAALVHPPTARFSAWVVVQLNRLTFEMVEYLDRLRWFRLIWGSPPVWWIPLYFGLGGFLLIGFQRLRNRQTLRIAGIRLPGERPLIFNRWSLRGVLQLNSVIFSLLILFTYIPIALNHAGSVSLLDVGQGDAILIQTPDGHNILVDGGGTGDFHKQGEEWKKRRDPYEVGRKVVVPLLKKRGIHVLDAIIITHNDQDHVGGLLAVIKEIPVRQVYFNGTMNLSMGTTSFYQTALSKKIPLYQVGAGGSYRPDRHTTMHFLAPNSPNGVLTPTQNQNGYSLVFLLNMQNHTFLLTGDMDKKNESDILKELGGIYPNAQPHQLPTRLDVLKVAHHGSKSSSSEAWLSFWRPQIAVISVGKNNIYKHPAPEVTRRLEVAGIDTYRTDLQGEIRMAVSKNGISIKTKLE
ncbi:MAG: DNA internalization-related competence protein ComEC/Rec2 [Gorillibacterium sp.]|nr:DNA internalization-related competence protein ComEC/Rec2 [Gorillibacterium sp.]